jgi:hypothetical protein
MFMWVRATFPRYRYDQIMRLGWKIFIPVTLVWLVVVGIWMQTPSISGSKTMMSTSNSRFRSRPVFAQGLPVQLHADGTVQGHGRDRPYLFRRKVTSSSRKKKPRCPALSRPACAAPLRKRRRALHRLQAVRGRVPGHGDHHRVGRA